MLGMVFGDGAKFYDAEYNGKENPDDLLGRCEIFSQSSNSQDHRCHAQNGYRIVWIGSEQEPVNNESHEWSLKQFGNAGVIYLAHSGGNWPAYHYEYLTNKTVGHYPYQRLV